MVLFRVSTTDPYSSGGNESRIRSRGVPLPPPITTGVTLLVVVRRFSLLSPRVSSCLGGFVQLRSVVPGRQVSVSVVDEEGGGGPSSSNPVFLNT